MPLAEGLQASIRYKAYSSGTMTPNAQAVLSSDPGNTGGQVLRRVGTTLNLRKDVYRSAEIRTDRQIVDMRHGARRVEGNISGELSPATYFPLIEAAHRHTASAALADDASTLTSVAADNATSKFTFGGGDPVAEGYRIGDVIRFTGLSEAANNSVNFLITGIGGTSNRELTVYPAPTTMAADTAFDVSRPGKASFVPATGHVSRKFLFEVYNEDVDLSRLFKECRITGYRLSLPATGMATVEVMVMGRDMDVMSAGSAPFFASPTAASTTGCLAAVNGALYVSGTKVGVVTSMDIDFSMSAEAQAVVGQNFVPEIMLGAARVTGNVTVMLENQTLLDAFTAETEASILSLLEAGTTQPSDAVGIYLPRVKFGQADIQTSGEGAQLVQMSFEALRYVGNAAGVETTTIRVHDTAAA